MVNPANVMVTLNQYLDHTCLRPEAGKGDISQVCREAVDNQLAGVCIPPYYIQHASEHLQARKVNLVTVIGFPLGYHKISTKAEEARKAIDDGADELDMVINMAAFRSGCMKYVQEDIERITALARMNNKLVKIIIETGLLDEEGIVEACRICADCGVDYVKTCTGFNGGQANASAIRLIRSHLPASIKVKAAGGIRDADSARQLIEAGSDRLGTTSSLKIIADENQA